MSINTADLRALADFLDEHPRLLRTGFVYAHAHFPAVTDADWDELRRELGGYEKSADDNYLNATRWFGKAKAEVYIAKERTCERVQVGEREIEQTVYPSDVVPAVVKVTEPVYEWVCPESWLRPEETAA